MQHGGVQLRIKLSQQWRYFPQRVAFLLGLWTLLIQFANKREAKTGLEQRNESKITYTPWAASMLDCVLRELENRVFPRVFTHREPIRSHRLRSCDLRVGFQQSDARASQWWWRPPNLMFFHPWRSGILIWR